MKPTYVLIALLGAGLSVHSLGQTAARSTPAEEVVVEDTAVNPMTGRLLSEEELSRKLNVQKLRTQIAGEVLKQTQMRVESDRTLREARTPESRALPAAPVPLATSTKTRASARASAAASQGAAPSLAALPPPAPTATGRIEIGGEVMTPSARYTGAVAQVNFVDAQTRAPAAPAGASTTPLAPAAISMPTLPPPQLGTAMPMPTIQ